MKIVPEFLLRHDLRLFVFVSTPTIDIEPKSPTPAGISHGKAIFHTAKRYFTNPAGIYFVEKSTPKRAFFWCERWDSNPHGVTTRTSNVLVYHSNTLASA